MTKLVKLATKCHRLPIAYEHHGQALVKLATKTHVDRPHGHLPAAKLFCSAIILMSLNLCGGMITRTHGRIENCETAGPLIVGDVDLQSWEEGPINFLEREE